MKAYPRISDILDTQERNMPEIFGRIYCTSFWLDFRRRSVNVRLKLEALTILRTMATFSVSMVR